MENTPASTPRLNVEIRLDTAWPLATYVSASYRHGEVLLSARESSEREHGVLARQSRRAAAKALARAAATSKQSTLTTVLPTCRLKAHFVRSSENMKSDQVGRSGTTRLAGGMDAAGGV